MFINKFGSFAYSRCLPWDNAGFGSGMLPVPEFRIYAPTFPVPCTVPAPPAPSSISLGKVCYTVPTPDPVHGSSGESENTSDKKK